MLCLVCTQAKRIDRDFNRVNRAIEMIERSTKITTNRTK